LDAAATQWGDFVLFTLPEGRRVGRSRSPTAIGSISVTWVSREPEPVNRKRGLGKDDKHRASANRQDGIRLLIPAACSLFLMPLASGLRPFPPASGLVTGKRTHSSEIHPCYLCHSSIRAIRDKTNQAVFSRTTSLRRCHWTQSVPALVPTQSAGTR